MYQRLLDLKYQPTAMTKKLFDAVRDACRQVAGRAQHVHIDYDRLPTYVKSLPLDEAARPELDPAHLYLGKGDETVAFLITLDSINFGSGYFPHLRKRPGLSGYFTVASYLTEHYRKHGPLSAEELVGLTAEDCIHIFHQEGTNQSIDELMHLFAQALNDLGTYLMERFEGSFTSLVEAANHSALRLVELLIEIPFFNDVQTYDDLCVPFYKRAQLTAADLALAFDSRGPGDFDDLEQLTIFADNLVPHVLRIDGVLLYNNALTERIDREALIPRDSREEIELRASAVHAVECIADTLRESRHDITPMGLDYLLWNRGQQPAYKQAKPRHRTRTVYY